MVIKIQDRQTCKNIYISPEWDSFWISLTHCWIVMIAIYIKIS